MNKAAKFKGCRFSPAMIFFLLILLCIKASHAVAQPEAVPGQYLVKFKSTSIRSQRMMRVNLGVQVVKHSALSGTQLVEVPKDKQIDKEYAKKLLASGLVEYLEPNYVVRAYATPSDTRFGELWGFNNTGQTGGTADVDIDAPQAWDIATGAEQVVVGVVDSGVDYTHPDLAQNMWVNPNEIAGNWIDDDGNGVVDDVHGYNSITATGNPYDDEGHGTHCAGTIGAVANNTLGVSGVNWNVKIMALKFLDASGEGTTQAAIDAIDYAVRMKKTGVNIKVLSNSWGGGSYSHALEDAIQAAQNAGILFVAAAGNEGADNDFVPSYPANHKVENVVSVAALDHNGNLAFFSNYGAASVDLAAPGVNILSTRPGGHYGFLSGTSMAAPHVSGVAALLAGTDSSLSVAALKARILSTVKPLSTLSSLMRFPGTVSAFNALSNNSTVAPPAPERAYVRTHTVIGYDAELGQRVLAVDDGYAVANLPFSFPFYGQRYERIAVSANGRIVPLAEGESVPAEDDYSNVLGGGISPLHDDFIPAPLSSDGGVWYKSLAESVVITWVAASYDHKNQSNPANEVRFQAKLFSGGGIEFHYFDTYTGDPAYDYGASASVGIAPCGGLFGERLLVSENTGSEQELGSGRALRFDIREPHKRSDFDGDGKADIIVWRPDTAVWYVLSSGSNFASSQLQNFQHGLPGDIPLTGDFDGDARADLVVWRPCSGTWYFRSSRSNYSVLTSIQWGLPGDTPLSADYDGDGISDVAVYRPGAGAFYALLSSGGFNRAGAVAGQVGTILSVYAGGAGHDPVVGDFTGDGRDNFAVVWQLIRFWTVFSNSGMTFSSMPWGAPGDTPLACDIDGDGVSDRVVVRANSPSSLDWYISTAQGGVKTGSFGSLGDVPKCNRDYDGDGREDMTVFRNDTGIWYIKASASGELREYQFGLSGDIPL